MGTHYSTVIAYLIGAVGHFPGPCAALSRIKSSEPEATQMVLIVIVAFICAFVGAVTGLLKNAVSIALPCFEV